MRQQHQADTGGESDGPHDARMPEMTNPNDHGWTMCQDQSMPHPRQHDQHRATAQLHDERQRWRRERCRLIRVETRH